MIPINTVYNMDALTLMCLLDDECIDMGLTSPPYDNLRAYKGFSWDFEATAREYYRVLKPGGVLVWVVGDSTVNGSETLTSFRQALIFKDVVGFNVHDTMIWDKVSSFEPANVRYSQTFEYCFVLSKGSPRVFSPIMRRNSKAGQKIDSTSRKKNGETEGLHGNGKFYRNESPLTNIWSFERGYMKSSKDTIAFDHPATFPERLAERHILTWSNPGDLILDVFGGSGTTGVVARRLNRNFILGDIAAEYCDLMRRRLAKGYTPMMAGFD